MNDPKPWRVVFFGTPEFSCPALKVLLDHPRFEVLCVVTQPDRPAGRGYALQPSAVKSLAVQHHIPVLHPKSLKREASGLIEAVQALGGVDIGVVIAFGQILPRSVLELPKLGCINIHASLLPRWRGAAPIQRAIMAGDLETGVCLMQMDQGLDTGAVYTSQSLPIEAEDTAGTLHDKLAALGARLLDRDLPRICGAELGALAQDQTRANYAEKILAEECEIDWSKPAQHVARLVRGLSPFPGAFSWLDGKRVKILRAKAKHALGAALKPGQVTLIDRDRLEVQCGADVLCIEAAQLEGRKRLEISEFLRGVPLSNASIFGLKDHAA